MIAVIIKSRFMGVNQKYISEDIKCAQNKRESQVIGIIEMF